MKELKGEGQTISEVEGQHGEVDSLAWHGELAFGVVRKGSGHVQLEDLPAAGSIHQNSSLGSKSFEERER